MVSVVLIGFGNVGFHLANAFEKAAFVNLKQVYARDITKISHLKSVTQITDSLDQLVLADVYVLAVSDNAIAQVSSKLKHSNALVVHTSGATDLLALQNQGRKGVFYMLQSFSKEVALDFSKVPFCLEAQDSSDVRILESLARSIGKNVYFLNSSQRQYLHVSAVFVNNFVNHMYTIGNDICDAQDIPFDILYPLIQETVEKIVSVAPKQAQTGPARRNDTKTIAKHESLLNASQQKIYKLLTESIQHEYKL